jgi:hypothetical protein
VRPGLRQMPDQMRGRYFTGVVRRLLRTELPPCLLVMAFIYTPALRGPTLVFPSFWVPDSNLFRGLPQ